MAPTNEEANLEGFELPTKLQSSFIFTEGYFSKTLLPPAPPGEIRRVEIDCRICHHTWTIPWHITSTGNYHAHLKTRHPNLPRKVEEKIGNAPDGSSNADMQRLLEQEIENSTTASPAKRASSGAFSTPIAKRQATSTSAGTTCKAYVARGPDSPVGAPLMTLEDVKFADLDEHEVLIETVAVGICHSDITAAKGNFMQKPPLIPGHEGSGYVVRIGAGVSYVKPGDPVVLSYASCMNCRYCLQGRNPYCERMVDYNFSGRRLDGSTVAMDGKGKNVNALFFGQSSMSRMALAHENSCVKVEATREELKTFAPLGCGMQTGAGTIFNVCKPPPNSSILVFGAGMVGIAAMLAASMYSPAHLILVDISQQKLSLPATNVATHKVFSPKESPINIPERIREITNGRGVDFAIDAVGSSDILRDGHASLANLGTLITIGSAPASPGFDIRQHLQKGITYRGTHQGDAVPRHFVPHLIQLWRQSKISFLGLFTYYRFEDLQKALDDIEAGKVIKPVLLM